MREFLCVCQESVAVTFSLPAKRDLRVQQRIVIITKCWGEVCDFEPLLSFTVGFICGIHNENGKSKVQSTAQFTFRSKAVRDANL